MLCFTCAALGFYGAWLLQSRRTQLGRSTTCKRIARVLSPFRLETIWIQCGDDDGVHAIADFLNQRALGGSQVESVREKQRAPRGLIAVHVPNPEKVRLLVAAGRLFVDLLSEGTFSFLHR